jgi:PIN domain nuclease of toxin-antitoxin system
VSEPIYVLDASALLAVMLRERGAHQVEARLAAARISAVNLAEAYSKLQERGVPDAVIVQAFAELGLAVEAFDQAQAEWVCKARNATRDRGLSLGDRACLALAWSLGGVAVTTDRAWDGLDLGVEIELAR